MNASTGAVDHPLSGTADSDEVARFAAIADEWWDPTGKFRPLHQLAPIRLAFIRKHIVDRLNLDGSIDKPLSGVRLLDVGCGGGLVSEPLARLGADVTAIDAAARNIEVAKLHAAQSGLNIDYRNAQPEDLATAGEVFDIVVNLEVVEHVADLGAFMTACASMTRPGGGMVLSTINRTFKSLALAKIAAEYVLRWLPVGTHDWKKFVKPSELSADLRAAGMTVTALSGMSYNPLGDIWRLSEDLDVNYLAFATKD